VLAAEAVALEDRVALVARVAKAVLLAHHPVLGLDIMRTAQTHFPHAKVSTVTHSLNLITLGTGTLQSLVAVPTAVTNTAPVDTTTSRVLCGHRARSLTVGVLLKPTTVIGYGEGSRL
jgi:hypothetical protein